MFGQYPVPCCDVPICVRIDQESSVQRKDRNRKYQYSKQQCRHIGRNDQIIFLHRLKSLSGLRPQPQNQCMGSLQIILVAQGIGRELELQAAGKRTQTTSFSPLAAEDDLNCRCSQPASAQGLWPARPDFHRAGCSDALWQAVIQRSQRCAAPLNCVIPSRYHNPNRRGR